MIEELVGSVKFTKAGDTEIEISNLTRKVVGCKSVCPYCNRKCENDSSNCDKHDCEKFGHQMRLFADGIFEYDDGKVGPSFSTCDLIDPSQSTKLGFRSLEWKDLMEEA